MLKCSYTTCGKLPLDLLCSGGYLLILGSCSLNFHRPSTTSPNYFIVDPTVMVVPPTMAEAPCRGAFRGSWKARASEGKGRALIYCTTCGYIVTYGTFERNPYRNCTKRLKILNEDRFARRLRFVFLSGERANYIAFSNSLV